MTEVLFARAQMAISLGFHIVFASVGVAMPVLMVIAEVLWRRTGEALYLDLTRRWSKGTAVLFAVGAVSGTVLSFELGLLFPTFMRHAGAVIGMPFSLEGFAFFTEAIFLGIYLYGWQRVGPALHIASGVLVALSGMASAVFVIIANAWMNVPRGFRLEEGRMVDIDPIAAMGSPFVAHEVAHMLAAAYLSTAFAAAAMHAFAILRDRAAELHRRALAIALWVAIPFALVQPLLGHWAGREVALRQPLKLAAMEGQERTEAGAPMRVGPIEVPGGLSWLAFGRTDAVVRGLEDFPRGDWPHPVVQVAFRLMVAMGIYLAAVSTWAAILALAGRPWHLDRWLLRAILLAGPMGFLAIEAGWIVTEMGRQPWVIYGVLRTEDSVTPMPWLVVPFVTFTLVYLFLAAVVAAILRGQLRDASGRAAT